MAKVSKKSKSSVLTTTDLTATLAEIEANRSERVRTQNLIKTLVRLYRLCYAVPTTI